MRVFFKGLTELRAVAALAVVITHVELYKHRAGIVSLYDGAAKPFVDHLGANGVYLFFVLSGFLITYLLLSEMRETGRIAIGKFYLRRALRIWPVYYLVVAISFFVFPAVVTHFQLEEGSFYHQLASNIGDEFWQKLALFILFLPNLALVLFPPVAGVSQSWSVGVEEQFYILWPLLLGLCQRWTPAVMLGVIAGKFALLGVAEGGGAGHAAQFLRSFNIELMAVGGLGAWLLHRGYLERVFRVLPRVGTVALVALIGWMLWSAVSAMWMGVAFLALIILNTRDGHEVLRSRVCTYLGTISYGIYMYHPLVMFFSYALVNRTELTKGGLGYNGLVYGLTLGGTILVSGISYRWFERFFLRRKERLAVIDSGRPA